MDSFYNENRRYLFYFINYKIVFISFRNRQKKKKFKSTKKKIFKIDFVRHLKVKVNRHRCKVFV